MSLKRCFPFPKTYEVVDKQNCSWNIHNGGDDDDDDDDNDDDDDGRF